MLHLRTPPRPQFQQHGETQAADDDASGDGQYDARVVNVGHEVVGAQAEASVVERGDRVERTLPHRRQEAVAIARGKAEGQHNGYHQLSGQGKADGAEDDGADFAQVPSALFRGGAQAPFDAHLSSQNEAHHRGECHDAEASDLDQQHDDDLPEMGPVGRGVHDGETGQAGGRRGGEKSGGELRALRPATGYGQQQ